MLCVIHEAGNIGLEQRCAGAAPGLGAEVRPLQVDINDLTGAQSTITSQLQSDPAIDAVLTLNSAVAAVAVESLADAGSDAAVATFDLNQDVISGIQDGSIAFAVDQQQYEQGYLPIVMLQLYAENLNTVGGGQPVLTGPGHRRRHERRRDRRPGLGRHALSTAGAPHPVDTGAAGEPSTRRADERLTAVGPLRRLLVKPELGALVGAVAVFTFFAVQSDVFRSARGVANWLDPASTLGIMAVAVALLMIGGHFDLSAGVMTGTTALTVAIVAVEFEQNIWVAIAVSLVVALLLGFFNGWLVTRTGLPSFIITLGTFLMLQGLNLGLTKYLTGTVTAGGLASVPGFSSAEWVFASRMTILGAEVRVAVLWWVLFTALATWVLLRTRFGNWVFATGGDEVAARNVGVPARRTTITLFMTTATAAWFVGTTLAVRLTSVQANTGTGQELIYIVAAVIGGCLLTGGFGSAIGASLGALIFGMTQLGIPYLRWDADWFYFFLGAMLLLAVLANRLVRRYAEAARR